MARYFKIQQPLSLSAGLVMTSSTWTDTWYPFPEARGAVSGSSKLEHAQLLRRSLCRIRELTSKTPFSSLAYSELYLAFTYMFRYLDMQLYETTPDDMKWGDFFAAITRKHLTVKVLSSTDLASDKTLA